jgi:hypothetical protein
MTRDGKPWLVQAQNVEPSDLKLRVRQTAKPRQRRLDCDAYAKKGQITMPRMPHRIGGQGEKPASPCLGSHIDLFRRPIAPLYRLGTPALGMSWNGFRALLGPVPAGKQMAPLTVLTVQESGEPQKSVGHFSLADLLASYARDCPDRMRSLFDFIASSDTRVSVIKIVSGNSNSALCSRHQPSRRPTF